MPDTERTTPSDWSDAFASLPMETPPSGGWKRLEKALDSPHATMRGPRRRQWPMWLAAAAIGAVALVPALRRSDDAARAPEIAQTAPLAAKKRVPVDITRPPAAASRQPQTRVASTVEPSDQPDVARRADAIPNTKATVPATTPRIAAATTPHEDATTDPRGDDLRAQVAALQAESAQLEALLALARDDRVASASGAAVTVELDRRVGRIDASLSQPGLTDADRAALWQARVSAMRELAGFETTQRWLVASGERYDGALVSVD